MGIRVGISACLLGEPVRFDGGHCRDRFLTDALGPYVEWVPMCPELAAGMDVPRPAVRLIGTPEHPRLVEPKTGADWTGRVRVASHRLVDGAGELCGFVVKSRSPSCGMERVRVYRGANQPPSRDGVGAFTQVLRGRFPLLPIEEDGRLRDPHIREAFLHALFAYARWREIAADGVRRGQLVDFHTRNKYLLLAHDPPRYQWLGRLVANAKSVANPHGLARCYERGLMTALRRQPTVRRHVNVLQHLAGHIRRHLDGAARAELVEAIADYRGGLVSRSVPLTLVRHHVREHGVSYLARQTYLQPCPKPLRSGAVLT